MVPFHVRYTPTRRQRFAAEIEPVLPSLAAGSGFTVGVSYLSAVVSVWFLPLLLLPPIVYRKSFALLFDLATGPQRPVDLLVEGDRFGIRVGEGERKWLPLAGIIQVYRSPDGSTWTILHLDGSAASIPADAIVPAQLDYLKGFARRAAAERRASFNDGPDGSAIR